MGERLTRKLAAIFYADVAGYSLLTGVDEEGTHRLLSNYLDVLTSSVKANNGSVVHYAGDAVLAEFSTATEALVCATDVQANLANRNQDLPDSRKIQFRIGVNVGEVIVDREDIYGNGVNVAARLEALAEPGGICISDAVRTAVGKTLDHRYEFLGEQRVKNIAEPVRAYRVLGQGAVAAPTRARLGAAFGSDLLPPGKPSLAILPFSNFSGDADQDYFAAGLTLDIQTALVKLSGLFLISEDSSGTYKSAEMTPQEFGHAMGVQHVLFGGIRKVESRIRVNAQLLETATGIHIWAERYDRDAHDIFLIGDEITEKIVVAMDVKLVSGEDGRIYRQAIDHPEALEHSYRGFQYLYGDASKAAFLVAHREFEEAIRLAPESPMVYAQSALGHWFEVFTGQSEKPSQSLKQAEILAQEALNRKDTSGYAQMVLAYVYLHNRNFEQALSQATDAIFSRPSCQGAYSIKASILTYLDRAEEAVELAQYAVRLTPATPAMYPAILANAYYGCDRYEEAIGAANTALGLAKNDISCCISLAASYAAMGHIGEAQRAGALILEIDPKFSMERYKASQPYKNSNTLHQLVDHLYKAGLR